MSETAKEIAEWFAAGKAAFALCVVLAGVVWGIAQASYDARPAVVLEVTRSQHREGDRTKLRWEFAAEQDLGHAVRDGIVPSYQDLMESTDAD